MNETSRVRGAISDAIAGLDGWTKSRWAPDLYGKDTDHLLHHSFAVGVTTTSPDSRDNRQRVSEGLLVASTVEVQWAHRLRGDAQSADYDAMLDDEQAMVGAVRSLATFHVLVESMERRAGPEGWILGRVRFRAVHRYGLQE